MVYTVRQKCGRQLAIEAPVVRSNCQTSDLIVAAVPESAIPAALGYAQETRLPYVEVFCKNRYVGKLLVQEPDQIENMKFPSHQNYLFQSFYYWPKNDEI